MRTRLSVSLPAELVEAVKVLAEEQGETRSRIVANAIRRVVREERNREITRQLLLDERERREQESLSDEPRWFDTEAIADSLAYTEDQP